MKIIKEQNITIIVILFTLILISGFSFASWLEFSSYTKTKTCADENSYQDAVSDMENYPNLDGNKNGMPCESKLKGYLSGGYNLKDLK